MVNQERLYKRRSCSVEDAGAEVGAVVEVDVSLAAIKIHLAVESDAPEREDEP